MLGVAVGLPGPGLLPERGRSDIRGPGRGAVRAVARQQAGRDDMCFATPAISGDRLLIRTSARIYCIRNDSRFLGETKR